MDYLPDSSFGYAPTESEYRLALDSLMFLRYRYPVFTSASENVYCLILDIDYNSYKDDQEGYYHEKGDEKGSETDNEEYW